jgi:hypothetical protein
MQGYWGRFVVLVTLPSGDLIKEDEIKGACGMYSREQKYIGDLVRKSEGQSPLGLGLHGRKQGQYP